VKIDDAAWSWNWLYWPNSDINYIAGGDEWSLL
jgi:hypothetical protein